jgi:hypothetical protein
MWPGVAACDYTNGQLVHDKASWEAGIDGVKPGIIMPADPQVRALYHSFDRCFDEAAGHHRDGALMAN